MQNVAHRAYEAVSSRTMGDEHVELAVFRQITSELQTVLIMSPVNLTMWADAINRNMELWTILSADLLRPENALAEETRRGLLQLAEFVRRTSFSILAGSGEIADLVEINQTIIAGLEGAARPDASGVA